MSFDPKHRSRTLIEGRDRSAARSYFKAIGLTDEDLARPIIGVANTWIETMPCNFNVRRLAAKVKEGIRYLTAPLSDVTRRHLGAGERLLTALCVEHGVRNHGYWFCGSWQAD